MTRKDYVLLTSAMAQAVNLSGSEEHRRGVYHTIGCLADALNADNKAFDKELFIFNISADVTVKHDDDRELDRCIKYLEQRGFSVQVMKPDMEW